MPTTDRVTFDDGQMGAYDELSGAAPVLLNMVVEGSPERRPRSIRTRPGIAALSGFPTNPASSAPVVAMTVLNSDLIYVTDDGSGTRKAYMWRPADGTVSDLSLAGGTALIDGSDPVALVSWRNLCFAAGGQHIQVIDPGLASRRLGGSPPVSVDLAIIAQRLVSVRADTSGIFDWAGIGEAEVDVWDILEFREAEARPDRLIAIEETARELWLFGASTTQIFIPDANEVFTPGPTLETGCFSKRSVVRKDSMMAWYDDRERIVLSDGRGLEVISDNGIASTLQGLGADVFGFRATIGNHDLLCWSWESKGRAFAWDMVAKTWSEFRGWRDNRWQTWAPKSYLWWPERMLHLVGMDDGSIATLSMDAHDDQGDPIRWAVRTGFREAPQRRHCVSFQVPLRRGEASSDESVIDVSWRDDLGPFVPPIDTPLGEPGEHDPVARVEPAGEPYERRQWELSGSAADAYRIAPAKELYEEAGY